MQQDSAVLIYGLNTIKGTVESYLSWKNRTANQNSTVPGLKNRTLFYKSKKNWKLFWATLNNNFWMF